MGSAFVLESNLLDDAFASPPVLNPALETLVTIGEVHAWSGTPGPLLRVARKQATETAPAIGSRVGRSTAQRSKASGQRA